LEYPLKLKNIKLYMIVLKEFRILKEDIKTELRTKAEQPEE
jgi:hypothetical protein